MFKALLSLAGCERRRLWPLSRARFGAATLHFFVLGGCSLEQREGDGLVSDGLEVTVAPTTVYETGGPARDAAADILCTALPLFQQKVVPHFAKSCALDCHDGTKRKAQGALDMTYLKTDVAFMCNYTINVGVDPKLEKLQAPILTSADPARTDKIHDFKYKTAAEFAAYRDDVMVWLNAERP
jgi:hypothetical protein